MAEKLLNEIEIMRDIDHKHIIKLLGTCVCYSNNVFVCMESMASMDLKTYLAMTTTPSITRHSSIDKEMLVSVAHQICSALCYLAKKYVVHRDLACKNVFVGSENFVKLGNFGLARHLDLNNQFIIKSDIQEGLKIASN